MADEFTLCQEGVIWEEDTQASGELGKIACNEPRRDGRAQTALRSDSFSIC